MISAEQKLQIEQYLISKKLPLDILLEVKDHMISQTEDYMNDKKMSFETAFLNVESSWMDNFSLKTYWMFYGREKLPKIAKDVMKQKFTMILLKSFSLSAIFFGLNFLLISYVDDFETYKQIFIISNAIFLLIPIGLYFANFKNKDHFRRDFKYKGQINYTLYQQNLTILLICFFGVSQIILEGGEQLYQFFESDHKVSVLSLIILSVYRLFAYTFSIFGIYSFLEHKKALKKLAPFINN